MDVGTSRNGFLGFLNNYQNSLSLLGFGPQAPTPQPIPSPALEKNSSPSTRLPPPRLNEASTTSQLISFRKPSDATASAFAAMRAASERRYRLPTLVAFMIIAFLLGSLLRSLLSPADFIYVVNDLGEATDEFGAVEPGWREIKRLVEVKYIVGGWDFQIAVVRRH
jgi:hypothetical protein